MKIFLKGFCIGLLCLSLLGLLWFLVLQPGLTNSCLLYTSPALEKIRKLPTNTTMDRFRREWYEGSDGSYEHYNWTRYYALNLHSVFYRGTLEWRCFESTLHALTGPWWYWWEACGFSPAWVPAPSGTSAPPGVH